MITELILNLLKIPLLHLISLLPTLPQTFSLAISSDFIVWLTNIVSSVAYFLPMKDIFLILTMSMFISTFHITWALIQRVWDALPFT